jgi:antitoxin MazE
MQVEGKLMKTTVQIKKWGNSLAIRIPSRVASDLGLKDNSHVQITTDGDSATIRREVDAPISLEDLVKGITPENVHGEMDWGAPVGKEVW